MLNNNRIGYLHFWCQKVLPLVYDNSLSYLEVLFKVKEKLNEVIKFTNEIPEYIDKKIIEQFDEEHLKELVSDVFRTIEDAISANNEGTNTHFSTDYPTTGTLVWHDNKLYKTMHPIDHGDTIIPDSNIELVNFGDMFNEFLEEVKSRFTDNDDGDRETSSEDRPEHDLVWLNNELYEAIKPIAEGNAYIYSGTNKNVEKVNLDKIYDYLLDLISDEVNAREQAIADEVKAREDADTQLAGDIAGEKLAREEADTQLTDDIAKETRSREDADTQIADDITDEALAREEADININNKIGDLSQLNTDNKSDIVSAINDALSRARVYETKTDLIADTDTHVVDELVYVQEVDCYYKIVNTSSVITLTLTNHYAELLADNEGFYHIDGLTTEQYQDIYPIISYLFNNNHTFIYIGKGNYSLSNTLQLGGTSTPLVKIKGAGKYNTVVNCLRGFIYVSISNAFFRGSEFTGFTASGSATGVVGGLYNGFEFISANNSPEDMYDNVLFDDMLIKYFNNAIRISVRCIWNLWINTDLIYNTYGFVFTKDTVDSFFNCNNFINCRIAENKCRAVSIYGKKGQAVSNNFVGCSIEGSYYTNETGPGNLVELDLAHAGVLLTGCHFEKFNTIPNATAICCVDSNLVLNECFFYNYTSHVYVNSNSQIVFNQPSLYGGTSLTAFGTDTGTTVKNNPYTF